MPGLPAGVDRVTFEDLRERYETGHVVVFAGAGVSVAAGLPTWKRLGELLVERMRALGKPDADVAEAEGLVARGELIGGLSAARLSLGREFDLAVARHLDDAGKDPPELAEAIAGLKPKLSGVVTTNLDHLVEDALGSGWRAIVKPVDDLVQRSKYVFKAHGTLGDAETWVFVRSEYDQVMFGSTKWLALFDALYRAKTLLFVGASLTDDDFGLTLGRIRALAGRNAPKHYAILPGPIGALRRDQLEKAGIRLLVYENQSGSHREAVEVLRELAGGAGQAAGVGVGAAPGLGQAVHPGPGAPGATPGLGQVVHPGPGMPATPAAAAAPGLGQMATPKATPGFAATPGHGVGATTGQVNVYISAAAADERFLKRLVEQLKPLEDAKLVRVSHAGQVRPGEDRRRTMGAMLSRAQIVLPLLSSDYTASAEQEQELASALTRADSGEAVVIPVLARPCLWQMALRGRDLQPLPASGKPLSTSSSLDDALVEVVLGVQGEAARLQKKAP